MMFNMYFRRRGSRNQGGKQNPEIEKRQTIKSTKHTHKVKLKTTDELACSGRVNISSSTSGIRRGNLVTSPSGGES